MLAEVIDKINEDENAKQLKEQTNNNSPNVERKSLVLSNNSCNNDSNDYSSDEKGKGSRLRLFKLMLGRTVLSVLKDEKYTQLFEQQIQRESLMSKIAHKKIISLKVDEDQDMVLAIAKRSYKNKLEMQFLINALSNINFFDTNSYLLEQPHKLCNALTTLFSPKGTTLFNYGDVCMTFYILIKGQVYGLVPKQRQRGQTRKNSYALNSPKLSSYANNNNNNNNNQDNSDGMSFNREATLAMNQQSSTFSPSHAATPKVSGNNSPRNLSSSIINSQILVGTPSNFSTPKKLFNKETSKLLWDDLTRTVIQQHPNFELVHTFNPGESFGQGFLLNNNCMAEMKLVCNENSEFITLKKNDFEELLGVQRELLERQKIEFLEQFEIFQNFSTLMLQHILELITIEKYQKDQIICKEGEESKFIYFIRSGEVKISFTYEGGNTNPDDLTQLNQKLKEQEQNQQQQQQLSPSANSQHHHSSHSPMNNFETQNFSNDQYGNNIGPKRKTLSKYNKDDSSPKKKKDEDDSNLNGLFSQIRDNRMRQSISTRGKSSRRMLDIIILQTNTYFGEEDIISLKSTRNFTATASAVSTTLFIIDAQKLMKVLKAQNNFDKMVAVYKMKLSWYVWRRNELIEFTQKQDEIKAAMQTNNNTLSPYKNVSRDMLHPQMGVSFHKLQESVSRSPGRKTSSPNSSLKRIPSNSDSINNNTSNALTELKSNAVFSERSKPTMNTLSVGNDQMFSTSFFLSPITKMMQNQINRKISSQLSKSSNTSPMKRDSQQANIDNTISKDVPNHHRNRLSVNITLNTKNQKSLSSMNSSSKLKDSKLQSPTIRGNNLNKITANIAEENFTNAQDQGNMLSVRVNSPDEDQQQDNFEEGAPTTISLTNIKEDIQSANQLSDSAQSPLGNVRKSIIALYKTTTITSRQNKNNEVSNNINKNLNSSNSCIDLSKASNLNNDNKNKKETTPSNIGTTNLNNSSSYLNSNTSGISNNATEILSQTIKQKNIRLHPLDGSKHYPLTTNPSDQPTFEALLNRQHKSQNSLTDNFATTAAALSSHSKTQSQLFDPLKEQDFFKQSYSQLEQQSLIQPYFQYSSPQMPHQNRKLFQIQNICNPSISSVKQNNAGNIFQTTKQGFKLTTPSFLSTSTQSQIIPNNNNSFQNNEELNQLSVQLGGIGKKMKQQRLSLQLFHGNANSKGNNNLMTDTSTQFNDMSIGYLQQSPDKSNINQDQIQVSKLQVRDNQANNNLMTKSVQENNRATINNNNSHNFIFSSYSLNPQTIFNSLPLSTNQNLKQLDSTDTYNKSFSHLQSASSLFNSTNNQLNINKAESLSHLPPISQRKNLAVSTRNLPQTKSALNSPELNPQVKILKQQTEFKQLSSPTSKKIAQFNQEKFGKRITSVLKLNKCVTNAKKDKIIDLLSANSKNDPLYF